jgi:hypothetical protein
VQYVIGSPVPAPHQNRISLFRAGIDSLIHQFPYPQYEDKEIMTMFTDCGFSLGSNEKIRLKVIKHFRSLSKQQLSFVLHGILDKLDNNISEVDLSTELLPLGSLMAS